MLARVSIRELIGRPGRALLTTFSVALAVAALVAVSQATIATRARFEQMRGALAERTPLEVVDPQDQPFDEAVCDTVAKVEGVGRVIPIFEKITSVYAEGLRARAVLLGVDADDLKRMRDVELVAGHEAQEDDELVLELGFAQSLHVTAGDTVRLLTPQGVRPVPHRVAGVLAFRGAAKFLEVSSVFLPRAAAQDLWNSEGEITAARLVLQEGVRPEQVSSRISEVLPEGVVVRPVRSRTDVQEETVFLVGQSLNITSTLSIGAAIFIVLNTYLMNVNERRRNLAIMRLIGATRGQIRRMLFAEGLFVAAIGTAVGIALGYFGGRRLSLNMDVLFSVSLPPQPPALLPLVIGAVGGPLITLCAVAYPAFVAGRTPPLTGMQGAIVAEHQRGPKILTRLGLFLLGMASLVYVAAIRGWVTAELSPTASALGMVAVVMLMSSVLRGAAHAASRLTAIFRPIESELACRQLTRHYVRSTLTAGVVFVVMCAGIGVGNTVLNAVADIELWQQRTFPADFLLRAKVPQLNIDEANQTTADTGKRIENTLGVVEVERMTFLNANAANINATLLVREYDKYDTLPIDLKEGEPNEVRQRLLDGGVLIGTVLAGRAHVSIGDEIPINVGDAQRSFRVAGIIGEYASGGLIVAMNRQTAISFLPWLDTHMFLVKVAPDEIETAHSALDQIAREEGLIVISYTEFRKQIQNMIAGVVGGLWMLLVLGFLIAAFGIVNTLAMNVLEQTRELGLMRVVGMTRAQVRDSIFAQALTLALIGLVPGVFGGVLMAWLSNLIYAALFAHSVTFNPQPLLVAGCVVVGLTLAVIAALLPARRASRLQPLAAIRME